MVGSQRHQHRGFLGTGLVTRSFCLKMRLETDLGSIYDRLDHRTGALFSSSADHWWTGDEGFTNR